MDYNVLMKRILQQAMAGLVLLDDLIIIGAPSDDDLGSSSGSVYMFEQDSGTGSWSETTKLTPNDGSSSDLFGGSVKLYDNLAIIGAQGDSEGSVYIFEKNRGSGSWSQIDKLEPTITANASSSGLFGYSVSVRNNSLIVGAPGQGSAYIFEQDVATGDWIKQPNLYHKVAQVMNRCLDNQ